MSVFDRRRIEALARELDSTGAYDGPASPAAALGLRLRAASADLAAPSTPRPEFRDALRTRLVAVATVRPVTAPDLKPEPTPSRGARRGIAVAAGALASVVAVSGVAVASSASLPGEPFYDVKRAAEGVQLALAGDAAEEGERHLRFAATRLDELDGLVRGRGADEDGPDWAQVQTTLTDMDEATRAGSTLLTEAWQSTGDRDLLTLLSSFTAEQAAGLQALLPAMAPIVLEQVQGSLALVGGLADTTRSLAGAPTSAGAPGAPTTPSPEPSAPATVDPSVVPTTPAPPPPAPSGDPASPSDEPTAGEEPAQGGQSPQPGGVPAPLPTLPAGAPLPTGATSVTPPPSLAPSLDPLLSPAPLPG